MRKRVRVLPYMQGSKGAKALATSLAGLCLKIEGSKFAPRPSDTIINWGNTNPPEALLGGRFLNLPDKIREASNKLKFFQKLDGSGLTPAYWTSQQEIPDEAFPIVCRTTLSGHSGAGIVIADTRADLVSAPLYVTYVKKKDEYRIHVGRRKQFVGLTDHENNADPWTTVVEVISVQQKKRRLDHNDPDWKVRNHANGFIYARSNVNPPACVLDAAKQAFDKLDLDFGAVDVIYNEHEKKAYVLEINTAPGLEGSTVKDYRDFFAKELA